MDPQTRDELVEQARAAAGQAYAPASSFPVGAALLGEDGQIFLGCNVENSSFGLTICAERGAVCQAVVAGNRAYEAIAIYTQGGTPGYPCGACRQVLAEFSPGMQIILVGDGDEVVETTLDRLLPHSFRFEYPQ